MVFNRAADVAWAKRLIGLPGDTVAFKEGLLSLNGQEVTSRHTQHQEFDTGGGRATLSLHQETLPGRAPYQIAFEYGRDVPGRPGANVVETVVLPGHLYVVGDYRDNSLDSRFPTFGQVMQEDLVGRLVYRLRPGPGWLVPPQSVPGLPQE